MMLFSFLQLSRCAAISLLYSISIGRHFCNRTLMVQTFREHLLAPLALPSAVFLIAILSCVISEANQTPWHARLLPANDDSRSVCKKCFWEQPIVGMGATSGEIFEPRQIRKLNTTILYEVEALATGEPDPTASTSLCPRWLVTTTINPTTPNLQAFSRLPGWCKVFVLDKKSPPGFALNGPGVVVLTVKDQEALPWRTARLTPWNHFGRKNLGYIYALLKGAEVIYDTDDDNFILTSPDTNRTMLPTALTGADGAVLHLAPSTSDGAFNPYPFWNTQNAWPRGFPLSLINTVTAKTGARRAWPEGTATAAAASGGVVSAGQRTCMLQSLANVDPDMDAIYRLTHPLPHYFPILGAQLMYPPGVYAPANAQATLISKELAAALMMPVTVHGRVSDIWRSYILQRVMWDGGCRLTFADPWVKQYRNAHGYSRDFQAELDLYLKAEGMLQVLNGIDFGSETALGSRVLAAFMRLYEYGLIEELDVKLAYAYLRDLSLIGPVPHFSLGSAATTAQPAPAPAPQQQPAERAAVCLTGMFRGGPFTLPLLKRNVLEALGMPFDVVVVTPNITVMEDDVADFLYLLPNLRAVIHPDYSNVSTLAALNWKKTQLTTKTRNTPAKLMAQLADVAACNDAIRKAGGTYTHAVRVRADTLVMDRLPVPPREVPQGHVVVPNTDEFKGINDRFAYGRMETMALIFDEIKAVPDLLTRAKRWNAEMMYLRYGKEHKIAFDRQPIQLCRFRFFSGGVLGMHKSDIELHPVCSQHCKRLRSCQPAPA